MLVNAVSANSTTFGRKGPSKEDFEDFAQADDRTLRAYAREAASVQVNDKKHRAASNAIWYSLPIAGGLAAVVGNPKVVGRIPKLKLFTKQTALWAGTFAVIDATFAAARSLNKHSSTVNEFNKEHPVLSTVATIGATVGALLLAGKGASMLTEKYGDKVIKFLKNNKVDKLIKENKLITNTMKTLRKAPSALKNFAKGVISWSPVILVATSIAHTFSHEKAKAVATQKNYDTLKTNQEKVRDLLAASEFADGE